MRAAAKGDLNTVSLYLDAGMDPNGEDDERATALSAATTNERNETIGLLVARGADPNRPTGWNPLHTAALAPSPSTLRTLLQCGADPNQVDLTGHSPAWNAIAPLGNEESIEVRLQYSKPYL
jgi:ankyrin repeat protein